MQVRAGPDQPPGAAEHRLAERQPHRVALPQRGQPFRGLVGCGRDEHPVDRADRRADHQIRLDPGLGQGAQHANLAGAEQAAAAEHESRGHSPSLSVADVQPERPELLERPVVSALDLVDAAQP
jgi:hypothetical protein